jgi:hypothetical protein
MGNVVAIVFEGFESADESDSRELKLSKETKTPSKTHRACREAAARRFLTPSQWISRPMKH